MTKVLGERETANVGEREEVRDAGIPSANQPEESGEPASVGPKPRSSVTFCLNLPIGEEGEDLDDNDEATFGTLDALHSATNERDQDDKNAALKVPSAREKPKDGQKSPSPIQAFKTRHASLPLFGRDSQNADSKSRRSMRSNVSECSVGSWANKNGSLSGSSPGSLLKFPAWQSNRFGHQRKIDRYYRKQSSLLEGYKMDQEDIEVAHKKSEVENERIRLERVAKFRELWMARVSFLVNVLLLVAKTIASAISGSLSVISSVVDSAVDITSGLVIWLAGRAIAKRDPYLYPRGRTRLEPLSLIIISVVMGVASIQMIMQSVQNIIRKELDPKVDIITIVIMGVTIAVKLALAIMCYCMGGTQTPSVRVLAQDHRNDCVSNSVAIVCAYVGTHFWVFADPIGAILVSLYIAFTWFMTGSSQMRMLTGLSAKPSDINRIIRICLDHDERIQKIDTVYAYHFGTKYLVEVHVVMDGDITLAQAHDVSEPLQMKIEHLGFVERAFVHVDYDTEHRPEMEHRPV